MLLSQNQEANIGTKYDVSHVHLNQFQIDVMLIHESVIHEEV